MLRHVEAGPATSATGRLSVARRVGYRVAGARFTRRWVGSDAAEVHPAGANSMKISTYSLLSSKVSTCKKSTVRIPAA